jgi:hypothetical protein
MSGSVGTQKSKGSSQTNETVTSNPLAAQMPAWNSVWQNAGALAGKDNSAALAPTAGAYTQAGQNAIGSSEAVRSLGLDTVGGKYLTNNYLDPAIQAATRGTWENFNRNVLPGIAAYGNASGAYGGTRNQMAAGLAAGEAMQDAQDISAKYAYDNYARERAMQMEGANLLGSAADLGLAGAGALGEGATVQDSAQMAQLAQIAQILSAGGFGTRTGAQSGTTKGSQTGASFGFTL